MMGTRFIAFFLLVTVTVVSAEILNKGWWKHAIFYQIYPRSFKDSDGDGIGDLKGIIDNLHHFPESGITAIWLSPICKSPMIDMGYDISDFRDVDKTFGTLQDLKDLIKKAHELGLKVILDLVPNHTSDKHIWFERSVNRTKGYEDYYIWSDGKKVTENGTAVKTVEPNNWLSVFNNSAWTYNDQRKQYYFHQFYKQQPDLNYNNEAVRREMQDIMKYWLDIGMDGFRIDAVPHLFEGNITQDEPLSNIPGAKPGEHIYLNHTLTKDQPKTYDLLQSWRQFVDQYANERNQTEKVLLTEAYTSWENTLKYYNYGSHVPFNFKFITEANAKSNATDFKAIIEKWMNGMPNDTVANWVMGNHDRSRLATRYPGRADQMTMLAMILPGVAVTYYGEEIGMEDSSFIKSDFRDGCRTPFQWDNSLNAGFSTSNTTWLPVNTNYITLNLKNEQQQQDSHYSLYKGLTSLRNSNALRNGNLHMEVLKNEVLTIVRKAKNETVSLLINFSDSNNVTVNLSNLVCGKSTVVRLSSTGSGLKENTSVSLSKVVVPAKASIVLHTASPATCPTGLSIVSVLLIACTLLFKS